MKIVYTIPFAKVIAGEKRGEYFAVKNNEISDSGYLGDQCESIGHPIIL
ncbi:hypothetical protein [Peribacillus sp. Bi134]|nr:hypothetical protein [Peribacillus sp. Bi134]CAH0187821.1 hypothetical protein SRABI134_01666 [Peribacillus sp. Bi134]